MVDEIAFFTSSVDLDNHPMNNAKSNLKLQYYFVLEYLVKKQLDNKFTAMRLQQYRIKLLNNQSPMKSDMEINKVMRLMITCRFQPWKKYRYWIMCDIALILMDELLIKNAATEMMLYMTKHQQQKFKVLLSELNDDNNDITKILFAKELIEQYRRNRKFITHPMRKFIVTANMSAGKSTLINALIGKQVARTSQEVCTGNTCYLYNKVFEDQCIHLENDTFSMNATQDNLTSISWDSNTSIASYFRGINDVQKRLCIIDTPGVNSVINRNHRQISYETLKNETYEKVIYVLNANKLGTDEEIAHIKWISENVQKDKVIFVLNKLDSFKTGEDDISTSIEGVRNDLLSLGFENPVICPISAYFSFLIKMKANGEKMTDDEIDEYNLYLKKFKRPTYDLSKYYEGVYEEMGDNEILLMSKKCGLYGLEKILFGGTI